MSGTQIAMVNLNHMRDIIHFAVEKYVKQIKYSLKYRYKFSDSTFLRPSLYIAVNVHHFLFECK